MKCYILIGHDKRESDILRVVFNADDARAALESAQESGDGYLYYSVQIWTEEGLLTIRHKPEFIV
jgi:hypothetical protein